MKNLILLFLLVSLTACQKTEELTWSEKRLLGSWFYTNVDFTEPWKFKEDITGDYFGQVLTFEDNFTFTLEKTTTGEVFTGVWQVNSVSAYSAATNSTVWNEEVIASYEDPQTGQIIQLVWDSFTTRKDQIMANSSAKDGHYYYVLKRF